MDLRLESVTKRFGREPVLDIPHFELSSGTHCALMGGSGLGKTTFLHLISGILLPTTGEVRLGEQSLSRLSERGRDAFRARNIGYIFQTFNLLPELTVWENIRLSLRFAGKTLPDEKLRDYLGRVGLADKAHRPPSELSLGQRQRAAVVRAVAHDPPLVLADEPTGSLDETNKARTLEWIRELCAGEKRTLIVVTHDTWVAGRFDTVLDFQAINRAARA